ncbi:MCE family protein [Rhodococcus sp. NPDC127530]|uniref:MCE family protein n=1 Tax=unclassified Rhodococcus (in: high G+C Gram-positive bacteria) TaxID=192944 RepID=UPI0036343E60
MILTRFVRVQLTIFSVLTMIALVVMGMHYMRLPALAGVGRYTVTVQLPTSGGLYGTSNVSYRGATIGIVTQVVPTTEGAEATLSLDSAVKVPRNAKADVHSRSAIGEQYVDLVPETASGPFLEDGDVISPASTSVPQDIAPLMDTVNRNLASIPQEDLTTVIDELYAAFNGTGPEIQRLLDSSNALLTDGLDNSDAITTLINDASPFLNSQLHSSESLKVWVGHLHDLTEQAAGRDLEVRNILDNAPTATGELTALFNELQPTLPILMANLTSLGQVGVTYNRSLEQLLVLLPPSVSMVKTVLVPDADTTKQAMLDFNLNLNAPAPCTTGFLPASERRDGAALDSPTRTADAIYCALPQDSPEVVRGARNLPCMDKPGKRAPTVEICKSDEEYVPKGTNPWIGNPTPTTDNPLAAEGNAVAQVPPAPAARPGVGVVRYNPNSGEYTASDGTTYKQSDLDIPAGEDRAVTVESLLTEGR